MTAEAFLQLKALEGSRVLLTFRDGCALEVRLFDVTVDRDGSQHLVYDEMTGLAGLCLYTPGEEVLTCIAATSPAEYLSCLGSRVCKS